MVHGVQDLVAFKSEKMYVQKKMVNADIAINHHNAAEQRVPVKDERPIDAAPKAHQIIEEIKEEIKERQDER